MPRSARLCASASRTRSSAAVPSRSLLLERNRLRQRVVQQLALARPGVVERPAVLRLDAQPERLLELGRGRGYALRREVHEQRRGDQRAFAERVDGALADAPAMQPDLAALEIGGQAELAISRDGGRKAPVGPAPAPARREP